jgi:hypothetical protein
MLNLLSCWNSCVNLKDIFRSLLFWNLFHIFQVFGSLVFFQLCFWILFYFILNWFILCWVSLNLLKTLPPSRVDKRFEEGYVLELKFWNLLSARKSEHVLLDDTLFFRFWSSFPMSLVMEEWSAVECIKNLNSIHQFRF